MKLTQTNDIGDLLQAINSCEIRKLTKKVLNQVLDGNADLLTGIKVAQLSLKHRQDKT